MVTTVVSENVLSPKEKEKSPQLNTEIHNNNVMDSTFFYDRA